MAVTEKPQSSAAFSCTSDCLVGSLHSLRGVTCSRDETRTATELRPGFATGIDPGRRRQWAATPDKLLPAGKFAVWRERGPSLKNYFHWSSKYWQS